MDSGSSQSAPGVDPFNVLSNWDFSHSNGNGFSDLSWEQSAFDTLPELDSYQDSNEGDAELFDLLSAHGPPSRDSLDPTVLDAAGLDLSASVGVADGVNFMGGTFSPRTQPSVDENSLTDNGWSSYQLANTTGYVMPLGVSYPAHDMKGALESNVIMDSEQGMHGLLTDWQRSRLASIQRLRQSVAYRNNHKHNAWPEFVDQSSAFIPTQFPISPPLEAQTENNSAVELNQHWFSATETPMTTAPATAPATATTTTTTTPIMSESLPLVARDASIYNLSPLVKPEPSMTSRSPSMHSSGIPSSTDSFIAIGNTGTPLIVESGVKEEQLQIVEWDEPVLAEKNLKPSPDSPKVSGFMVSQDTSDASQISLAQEKASLSISHSASRHTPLALQPASVMRKRKQRDSIVNVEQVQQSRPLQIVQEDGLGGAISSEDFVSPPRGARRKGPLSLVGRANAGLRRKNKDTCVQCRLNKRKCDGNSPCDACSPTLHEQPCARACFASIVEYGTCNYISQRAVNHLVRNEAGRRVRIEIPSAFDLNELVTFLGERRGKFNIRATQSWGSLYVLDLGETYKFLKTLSEYNDNSHSTFLEFIDHRVIDSKDKTKNWLSCVKDCDPMNNVFQLLSRWNNMPSRASYSFVSLDGSHEDTLMDVNNSQDRKDILMAAQLSRIFCRLLEVEGFRKLERDFYNIKWKRISLDSHLRFLEELGHILLSLRWRVSWWKRLGDGGVIPDPGQQHYIDRVELLCRILYVYYTSVLTKLPSWSTANHLKGKWSRYADTEHEVWDGFPVDATENGFHQWMDHGRELIELAGSPHHVASHISKA